MAILTAIASKTDSRPATTAKAAESADATCEFLDKLNRLRLAADTLTVPRSRPSVMAMNSLIEPSPSVQEQGPIVAGRLCFDSSR